MAEWDMAKKRGDEEEEVDSPKLDLSDEDPEWDDEEEEEEIAEDE